MMPPAVHQMPAIGLRFGTMPPARRAVWPRRRAARGGARMTVFRARRVGLGRCRPCAGPGLRRQPRRPGATPLPLRRRRHIQTRYRWQPRRPGATPLPPSLPRNPAWKRACAAATTAPHSTSCSFSAPTLRESRAPGHGRRARLAEAGMASRGRAVCLDGRCRRPSVLDGRRGLPARRAPATACILLPCRPCAWPAHAADPRVCNGPPRRPKWARRVCKQQCASAYVLAVPRPERRQL